MMKGNQPNKDMKITYFAAVIDETESVNDADGQYLKVEEREFEGSVEKVNEFKKMMATSNLYFSNEKDAYEEVVTFNREQI